MGGAVRRGMRKNESDEISVVLSYDEILVSTFQLRFAKRYTHIP